MSAAYSFVPWARQGMARSITAAPAGPRASVDVHVQVVGTPKGGGNELVQDVHRSVELYGPGDVIGLDPKTIIRTEPKDWSTDFEPNYLVSIEFYDEDLPWRHTPLAPTPDGRRLMPWLALVVLREDEFGNRPADPDKPLPAIEATGLDVFPPHDDLWAWAHVHVNAALSGGVVDQDRSRVGVALSATIRANADQAYSRLLASRSLAPDTAYHAFVVPAFESGRLSGLKLDPATTPSAGHGAWVDYPGRNTQQSFVFPYFHRWYFRTGGAGDFESLVRKLRPRAADPQVGRRDMDASRAGVGTTGPLPPPPHDLLKLGGALQAPRRYLPADVLAAIEADDTWYLPYPHPLQTGLAEVLNLPEDLRDAGDPDPVVTPPIYGAWHARQHRLLEERDGTAIANPKWLHDLNLDPRYRAPAGMGVRVVQKNQEDYMAAVWRQAGDVLAAIKKVRLGWMALRVAQSWNKRFLVAVQSATPSRYLSLVAPLRSRLMPDDLSLHAKLSASTVNHGVVSAALRRQLRSFGPVARRAGFTTAEGPMRDLAARIDAGEVQVAPPKVPPAGAVIGSDIADDIVGSGSGFGLEQWLAGAPWRLLLVLAILLLLALLAWLILGPIGGIIVVICIAAAIFAYRAFLAGKQQQAAAAIVTGTFPVDTLPTSPGFEVEIGDTATGDAVPGTTDSTDAQRFKAALKNAQKLVDAHRNRTRSPDRAPLDLGPTVDKLGVAVDPRKTIPALVKAGVALPPRIIDGLVFEFDEPMHYPRIDLPMYEPLSKISSELLAPNLNLIKPDTVTLLETNQAFIEAYMVGLNDEFGRELLWREFPTDQRGSYFRQFWDVAPFLDAATVANEAARDKLYDIAKLHRWRPDQPLGSNDNRAGTGRPREEAVLAIRGQLLKRYPNTLIYAHKAEWRLHSNGAIDRTQPRKLVDLSAAEQEKPPTSKVRTPIYGAHVDPDLYFLGFDLTPEDAIGDTSVDNNPGWFFVFEERPGEPRFGADLERTGSLQVWNDLAWPDIAPNNAAFIPVGAGAATPALTNFSSSDTNLVTQGQEDRQIAWGPNADAGNIAYMLFQAPMRVAYHGREMLAAGAVEAP